MKKIKYIPLLFFLFLTELSSGQEYASVFGRITDLENIPLEFVNISLLEGSFGTLTDKNGEFRLLVPANQNITLVISYVGYKKQEISLNIKTGKKIEIKSNLEASFTTLDEVVITADAEKVSPIYRISPKHIEVIPNISGNFESIIKVLPGVASNNELSSQYSVRGGNFDENLVYVNDIEVYRPFLTRSGQQEGLSFVNSEMVSSIQFSTGGFEAKYGDKMSSVLDIKYKKPSRFDASASGSLLGGSLHVTDISKNKKFTYNSGVRYKTSKYLLNSLSIDADYNPSFIDFQSFLTYQATSKIELNFLGAYAQNKYEFIPRSRETSFGVSNSLVSEIYDFVIHYKGQEIDKFETFLGAFSMSYNPRENIHLKFISSGFITNEEETFDIQGEYRLDLLENAIDPQSYNDSLMNMGIGRYLDHARNYLDAKVYSFSHQGTWYNNKNTLKWDVKYQKEITSSKINEWKMIDSAGYSIPYNNDNVILYKSTRISSNLNFNRITTFIQNSHSFSIDSTNLNFTLGIRGNFCDFNNEVLISPRVSMSVKPNWKRDILFYVAWGYYYQPPFYKEFMDDNGNINPGIKSQESIHYVIGTNYNCYLWGRPFKLITEMYYKHLNNLIPYKTDNVRIQYSGENKASGYATGIDFKLNGEFVQDAESWVSLSFMKTEENISNDFYYNGQGERIEPGYYPRPTDQRVNFNLFFQDYFPNNPTYRVQLNFVYGSRLPSSPPDYKRYDLIFRIPAYKRVDIGISKILKKETAIKGEKNKLVYFKSIWVGAEIFNLFNFNNTISYMWVQTTSVNEQNSNALFAVPNYLTSRRLNFKLIAKF